MARWKDPRPAHQQIAARIRDQIMSGRLNPGSKLPSTQQLMDEYGVVGTTEEFVALELPGEAPVLRTFRVVRSDHGRAIETTVMIKAGHLYELEYRLPVV
ncbi:GntR family transcriptional regulator [Streptomyces sp. SCA2-4]|nr:GntR family transcriptional regulator [Streptomyces huiliensis]